MDISNSRAFVHRTLSLSEYLHASVGVHKNTIDLPRENTLIVEGVGNIEKSALERAISEACLANPAVCVKLTGRLIFARWVAKGLLPKIREINNSEWDGSSSKGAEFIYDKPLDLRSGVICEFLIVRNPELNKIFFIFRNHHAVLDGIGSMHFLKDIFRALNNTVLQGSNTYSKETDIISDVDDCHYNPYVNFKNKSASITGEPYGDSKGDSWVRIRLPGPIPWVLSRMAGCLSHYVHRHDDRVVRVTVPVDLRRHHSSIYSTMNYTGAIHIDLAVGEGMGEFQKRLHKALKKNVDAKFLSIFKLFQWFPMRFIDGLLRRNTKNYQSKASFETVGLSDLGVYSERDFSTVTFTAKHLYGVPIAGSPFFIISTLGNQVDITMGMPDIYASEGRLNQLKEYLISVF
ncbi:hypothetical protein OAV62_00285 [bacterium]|nr:hypothetical protein [bacterium]